MKDIVFKIDTNAFASRITARNDIKFVDNQSDVVMSDTGLGGF